MQAELAYYGKFGELSYFDSLPWDQFLFYHNWLRDVKKEEAAAQEKARKEQEQALASARARSSRPRMPVRRHHR